jgi:hypothetical protein
VRRHLRSGPLTCASPAKPTVARKKSLAEEHGPTRNPAKTLARSPPGVGGGRGGGGGGGAGDVPLGIRSGEARTSDAQAGGGDSGREAAMRGEGRVC